MEQEKKYLKTIEEVSDALAAGKVVYDYDGNKYEKDKNGFIVRYSKGDSVTIGDSISLIDEPYILEPKPLEVKLWHLYEDRQGDKVLIGGRYTDDVPYPFYGMVKNLSSFIFYNKNGKSRGPEYDLVKEIANLSKYFEKGE